MYASTMVLASIRCSVNGSAAITWACAHPGQSVAGDGDPSGADQGGHSAGGRAPTYSSMPLASGASLRIARALASSMAGGIFSSAIAAGLATGWSLVDSITQAKHVFRLGPVQQKEPLARGLIAPCWDHGPTRPASDYFDDLRRLAAIVEGRVKGTRLPANVGDKTPSDGLPVVLLVAISS